MQVTTSMAAVLSAVLAAGSVFGQDNAQMKNRAKGPEKDATAAAILLVPLTFASDKNLGGGCWARLYDSENFRGNVISLVGPVDLHNLRTGWGFDMGREYDSVIVGPKATLTVYDNFNFRDRSATFKADQAIAEVNEKMGLFRNIRSLKVTCTK